MNALAMPDQVGDEWLITECPRCHRLIAHWDQHGCELSPDERARLLADRALKAVEVRARQADDRRRP